MRKHDQGFVSMYALLILLVCIALLQVLVQRVVTLQKTSAIKEGAQLYALRVIKEYEKESKSSEAKKQQQEEEADHKEEGKDENQREAEEEENDRLPSSWTMTYHQKELQFYDRQAAVYVQFPSPQRYCLIVSIEEKHKSIMKLAYEEGDCPH